jgi:hypothetical protein
VAAGLKVMYVSDPELNARLATAQMPVRAVDYLRQVRPVGQLYNPYEWGGFLSWHLYPDYPGFIDGRTDLYPDEFLANYLQLAGGESNWQALLARYNVSLVITQPASPLASRIAADPTWTRLYVDEVAVVFGYDR